MSFEYRPFDEKHDVDAFSTAVAEAFAADAKRVPEWIKMAHPKNLRIAELDGEVAGTCLYAPMGQFFGGKSLSMLGVAGVSVRPEFRGCGVGKRMMSAAVLEMAAMGIPLSTLYPSTMPLYQTVGYEMAGYQPEFEFSFDHLPVARMSAVKKAGLQVTPGGEADHEEIRQLYRQVARTQNGMLDRDVYIWQRIFKPRDQVGRIYCVRETQSGKLRGYVILTQTNEPDLPDWHQLNLICMQAADVDAWQAVFAFLRSYQSMARRVKVNVGANHPLYLAMPEQRSNMKMFECWMMRILSVPAALEGRGYPLGMSAELHFDIADDLIAANHGKWILQLTNGRAKLSAGGKGDLKISIRNLAPLFSGHVNAELLAQSGRLQAEHAIQAVASSIFAGSTPWMPDMF